MTVNYLAAKVALIAQLTGPDGSGQLRDTDRVQRKLATSLTGTKGGAGNVTNYTGRRPRRRGMALARPDGGGSYEIDPYNPFTRTLPTAGRSVSRLGMSLDSGNVAVDTEPSDETLTGSYLTATMPSNANLTIKKIQEACRGRGVAADHGRSAHPLPSASRR